MSAADIAKIRAAQKACWAKIKTAKAKEAVVLELKLAFGRLSANCYIGFQRLQKLSFSFVVNKQ